jgi:hypothetical protein
LCSLQGELSNKIFTKVEKEDKKLYMCYSFWLCLYLQWLVNLWMSKEGPDVLDFVVNFWSVNWQSKHVTIGLFEALKTIGQVLKKIIKLYWNFLV